MSTLVQAGEVRLNVVEQGAGPVLLWVHGFPLDATMWREQIEQFAGEYRVIAPDLRGFGGSQVVPGEASMAAMADDLAALLVALAVEEPVTFCGLSMGGYIAWQFWRRHPQLVLCDTRAVGDTAEVARGRQMMARQVESEGASALAGVAEGMLPKLFGEATRRERPELVEQTREVILSTAPAGVAAAQRGMAAREEVTGWLGEIRVPALVVVGEDDGISPPEEMRQIAEALPDARFELIADAGHMAPLEQPQAFNRALGAFLAEGRAN